MPPQLSLGNQKIYSMGSSLGDSANGLSSYSSSPVSMSPGLLNCSWPGSESGEGASVFPFDFDSSEFAEETFTSAD